ncbi:MAG: Uma2 family endonuclease [Planctomycetota bacterium]|nr:Uma2 family endonuclease [Planctomycetota bacterium]
MCSEPIGAEKRRVDPAVLRRAAASDAPLVAITVEQYHHMLEAGAILEGAPIELLNGMLVWKDRSARGENPMTIGDLHILVVGALAELLPSLRALNCHIRIQATVALPPNQEPEPDGAIVRGTRRDYADHRPGPDETLCVIEVADSSLSDDRTIKQRLYADAGIPQYLIINIPDKQIEVHEQPLVGQGRYGQVTIIKAGQNVPLLVPDGKRLEVAAAELLP